MKRQLTENEKKAIKGYNLSPQLEQKVWDIWCQEEKPQENSFFQKMVGQLIGLVVIVIFTASFFVNYFMPEIAHMQGLLNVARFVFWVILPSMVLLYIIIDFAIHKDEKEAFKKYALDCWQQKRTFLQKIAGINKYFLVFGLVLNGYFISAIMALICFFVIFAVRAIIVSDVQVIMNKVVSSQNGEIVEAEFCQIQQ